MAPKADEKAVRRKKATAEEKPKPDDEKQSKIDAKLEAKRIAAEERINRAWRMIYYYLIAFLGLIYVVFMASVPEPYMDEPFHVKQTQEYCAGNWSVWDEKITTFPGLYLLGAGVAAVVRGLAAIGALPPSAAAGTGCSGSQQVTKWFVSRGAIARSECQWVGPSPGRLTKTESWYSRTLAPSPAPSSAAAVPAIAAA